MVVVNDNYRESGKTTDEYASLPVTGH